MNRIKILVVLLLLMPAMLPAQDFKNRIHDPGFARGFDVVTADADVDTVCSHLLVDSTATPVWTVRQYNSKFDISNNNYDNIANRHHFRVPGNGNLLAKTLSVNPAKGSLTLECNASAEYKGIRRSNQPWVYLTVDAPTDTVAIAACKNFRLMLSYKVNYFEDCMGFLANTGFHAATYRICIMMRNFNRESISYGKQMRLALVLFDNRYMGNPCEARLVTNLAPLDGDFAYYPKSALYMPVSSNSRLPKVRQQIDLNVDMMPILREALRTAQSNDLLSDTVADDWEIVACDMGWEMTGTYNAALRVKNLQLIAQ